MLLGIWWSPRNNGASLSFYSHLDIKYYFWCLLQTNSSCTDFIICSINFCHTNSSEEKHSRAAAWLTRWGGEMRKKKLSYVYQVRLGGYRVRSLLLLPDEVRVLPNQVFLVPTNSSHAKPSLHKAFECDVYSSFCRVTRLTCVCVEVSPWNCFLRNRFLFLRKEGFLMCFFSASVLAVRQFVPFNNNSR